MELLFSPYTLVKKNSLEKQEGVLLKLTDEKFWGVADICPHLALGDQSYFHEIRTEGPLFKRSFELALQDLRARQKSLSLLKDKTIPNNFLITDYVNTDLNQDRFQKLTIKIKGDKNIEALLASLVRLKTDLTLRLDFNSKLNDDEFELFLHQLPPTVLQKIEYIEDPTILGPKWKEWNKKVPLAFDFQQAQYDPEYAQFKIIKPSREIIDKTFKHFTLTSAMDHPVGLAHGLRLAQREAQNTSGFLTLDLYQNGEFDKYFVQAENTLTFSPLALNDSGIGMTEALQRLQWVPKEEFLT